MHCPTCHAEETRVVDSRLADHGAAVRRRRECLSCTSRFTTFERIEVVPCVVVKSDGRREPFDRSKLIAGISAAVTGRSVSSEMVDEMGGAIERALRELGNEVTSAAVGLAVLEHLREVDEVAYLRFASVYKDFDAAADFHREIELLDKLSGAAASG